MNATYIFYIAIAVILTSGSCDQYEFPESPYPRVETTSIEKISQDNFIFRAKITRPGSHEPLEHGFIWGLTSSLTGANAQKINLGDYSGIEDFAAELTQNLEHNKTYYVKAYFATESYRVYGEVKTFTN